MTVYSKKYLSTLALLVPALAVSLTLGLMGSHSASAKGHFNPASTAASLTWQNGSVTLPRTNIYALDSASNLYLLRPGSNSFSLQSRVRNVNGNLIGIDFRVADRQLYALSDTGNIYTINLSNFTATQVSTLSPRFAGGVQSLFDFNPVQNAVRIQGSNDQNYAATNNAGNLNQTVVQTRLAYAAGDVNAGVDPNIAAGSYSNNFVGAATTLFYMIDYDLDTFVTIAQKNATGSSNTGGGQLQTVGGIFDNNNNGRRVDFSSTADFDIYTDANRVNTAIVLDGQRLYMIPISQVNQNLPVGASQNIGAFGITLSSASPAPVFIDVAAAP
ncbi:MAG TPA: DUF4394 domain-containing protein [Blastocatellia bacterium]|nr:DUF4394 domain-containing protein [Blastocatellia bacterium]